MQFTGPPDADIATLPALACMYRSTDGIIIRPDEMS